MKHAASCRQAAQPLQRDAVAHGRAELFVMHERKRIRTQEAAGQGIVASRPSKWPGQRDGAALELRPAGAEQQSNDNDAYGGAACAASLVSGATEHG